MDAAQHRCARAVHRLVTGSQTRLPTTIPAVPAMMLLSDSDSSLRTPATTAPSTTVPTRARVNRRVEGQAPTVRSGRLARVSRPIVQSGAATRPAIRSAPNIAVICPGSRQLSAFRVARPAGPGGEHGPSRLAHLDAVI